MSILESLNKFDLAEDATVELSYESGCDCFMHTDDAVETALQETDVVERLADLVAIPGLEVATQWGSDILEDLRDNGLLEDYERDGTFSEFLTETIRDNFYDQEAVESSVEAYDYKRGFCTLTAVCSITYENLLSLKPDLGGWTASVTVGNAKMTVSE